MRGTKYFPMVMTAVFAALLAVFSQLSIPMPSGMPITLQTFAVALTGYVLGMKRGTLATAVYLALGAVGLPVLANFYGGFGAYIGITGGYLWGFLPLAALCGLGLRMKHRELSVVLGLSGLLLCHVFGTVQFAFVSNTGVLEAFLIASAPYLIKDVLSVAAAFAAAVLLRRSLNKGGVVLGD